MQYDHHIAADMWRRIGAELDSIERDHGVRILLAVESGSRAWRFPSPDSDYDVRFIYAYPREAYLSIELPRDVIERPIDGVLDLSGWDVRKALQLMIRSNAALIEWLASPVRYRAADSVPERLLALAHGICTLPALAYHYDRTARRSFDEIAATRGPVRLKAYCYAVRPVLALLWMRGHERAPPMDLPSLLQGVPLAADIRRAIDELVARKATAGERELAPRVDVLDNFLAAALADKAGRASSPADPTALARANALFAQLALGEIGSSPSCS
jgi:predicted nucleotidyltransferase